MKFIYLDVTLKSTSIGVCYPGKPNLRITFHNDSKSVNFEPDLSPPKRGGTE
jgi:hypothetical protein